MDHWGPKHVEPPSVMNKLNHKTLCIWLVYIHTYIHIYIYIARWYTVHSISSKGKVVALQALKAHRESGDAAPLILNFGRTVNHLTIQKVSWILCNNNNNNNSKNNLFPHIYSKTNWHKRQTRVEVMTVAVYADTRSFWPLIWFQRAAAVLWYFGSCWVWFILKSSTAAGDYLFHSIKYIDNVDQNAAAGYLLHPAR